MIESDLSANILSSLADCGEDSKLCVCGVDSHHFGCLCAEYE